MKTPTNYGGWDLASWLLANNEFVIAELYTFALTNGMTLRYTSADANLIIGGNTFDGGSVIITRGTLRTVIGLEVDTLDLDAYALPTHLVGSTPFLKALRAKLFNHAQFRYERFYTPAWGSDQYAIVLKFTGLVGDSDSGRFHAKMRINSDKIKLNIQMPRNLYGPGCLNVLYDGASCKASKAAFGVSGSVTAGSTQSIINTNLSAADGYFDMGAVTFTSGANAGLTVTVKRHLHSNGQVTLIMPFPGSVVTGDSFTIYPGCDKTMATCVGKFSNLLNFRGEPFIPVPETAL